MSREVCHTQRSAHIRVPADVPCTSLFVPFTSRFRARCAQCACLAIAEPSRSGFLLPAQKQAVARLISAVTVVPVPHHDRADRATLGGAAVRWSRSRRPAPQAPSGSAAASPAVDYSSITSTRLNSFIAASRPLLITASTASAVRETAASTASNSSLGNGLVT